MKQILIIIALCLCLSSVANAQANHTYDWTVFKPLPNREVVFIQKIMVNTAGQYLILANHRVINNSMGDNLCFISRVFIFPKGIDIPTINPIEQTASFNAISQYREMMVSTDVNSVQHYFHLSMSFAVHLEEGDTVAIALETFTPANRYMALWDSREFANNFQLVNMIGGEILASTNIYHLNVKTVTPVVTAPPAPKPAPVPIPPIYDIPIDGGR